MSDRPLEVENQLADRVRLVGFELHGVDVAERSAELERAVNGMTTDLRSRFADPPSASSWTDPARRLYRALGIDPSRRRPSSEALLRRILQGKGLYTVNTAVDAANLASLRIALPVGLYDRDRIVATTTHVVLRMGKPGESYAGIRKDDIHVEQRPTLVDDMGAFGNPSSDSARTQISVDTSALFFVVYAPVETDRCALEEIGTTARDTMIAFVGGRCPELWLG